MTDFHGIPKGYPDSNYQLGIWYKKVDTSRSNVPNALCLVPNDSTSFRLRGNNTFNWTFPSGIANYRKNRNTVFTLTIRQVRWVISSTPFRFCTRLLLTFKSFKDFDSALMKKRLFDICSSFRIDLKILSVWKSLRQLKFAGINISLL